MSRRGCFYWEDIGGEDEVLMGILGYVLWRSVVVRLIRNTSNSRALLTFLSLFPFEAAAATANLGNLALFRYMLGKDRSVGGLVISSSGRESRFCIYSLIII